MQCRFAEKTHCLLKYVFRGTVLRSYLYITVGCTLRPSYSGPGGGAGGRGAQTPEPSVDLSTLIPDPTEILGGKTVKVREESAGIYSISIHNCSKDEAKKYIDLLKAGKWTKNAEYTDKLIASAFTAEDESGKLGVKAEFSPLQKILRVTVKKTTPETGAVSGGQTE